MVNKLRAIFYSFVASVLVLFAVFVFLMTTVNPPRDPNLATEPATQAPTPPPDGRLRRFMDFTTKSVAADTFTEEIVSKGRRSINDQRTTKDEGLVIMKVVDDESRPRIEVVLYPRWADSKWKIYRMDSILDPKYSGADLLPNSIFMSEDTIVVENDEFSPKWGLNSYTTSKSVRRNAISLDSQEITKVDTILPPEKKNTLLLDDYSPITNTSIKLNDIEQEQTQIKTKNINTDILFNILTNTTSSIAANKVTSPESITGDNITNVTAVLYDDAKTETLDTSDTIEKTTETVIFLEDSVNKSVTANSINQSVIDNISNTGEDKSQVTSEKISKDIPLDVDSVETFNHVTIKAVSAEPMMEQITEVAAVLLNTETSDISDIIENTTEIPKDIPSAVDSVENFNDVTIKAVSAEPMTEQITEVITISLNTETETTTETTILETTTE